MNASSPSATPISTAVDLVTFPSARGHEAIRHILVPHDPALGGQEESASREVDEVVGQVLGHAAMRPDESLGVITMGIKHANRIQAALDRALDRRPELSEFFSLDREERFFVKNLETVQGDERDAIILSIGYGKTANGDLPHRFGPLTQEAGHRRLNVGRHASKAANVRHQLVLASRDRPRPLWQSWRAAAQGVSGLCGERRRAAARGGKRW
jgi:hypothetical protein